MLKKIMQKIESNRDSNSLFWKILVLLKDTLWKILDILKDICYELQSLKNRFFLYIKCKLFPLLELFFYRPKKDRDIELKIITGFGVISNTCTIFNKYCKDYLRWNNLRVVNKLFADYYIIINHPYIQMKYYNPKKTIIFQAEPIIRRKTWKNFSNPKRDKYFYVYDTKNHNNCVIWHINKDYNWLMRNQIKKTKVFSAVTSSLYNLEGHKKRLDFLEMIDKNINIEVYGRINKKDPKIGIKKLKNLANYKGFLPMNNKEEGLIPYKYTFVAENSSEENYFTEKIVDAILSECLCFYGGCPNIDKFIDPRAYIKIDLDKPNEAIKIIQEAIKNNEWEKRIFYIKKEKKKILNELQIMPTIEKIILKKQNKNV